MPYLPSGALLGLSPHQGQHVESVPQAWICILDPPLLLWVILGEVTPF